MTDRDALRSQRNRWSAAEVIQSGYVTAVLSWFVRSGALEALRRPLGALSVARHLGCRVIDATTYLRFIVKTTDILVVRDGRYQLRQSYRPFEALQFHLQRMMALTPVTRSREMGRRRSGRVTGLISEEAFAAAFASLSRSSAAGPSLRVLTALRPASILDLGSGAGGTLLALASQDRSFVGLGVDVNSRLCSIARARAHRHGCARRVRFVVGDVESVDSWIGKCSKSVDVLHASCILNQFRDPWRLLRKLRRAFPGRVLVSQEYLGKLHSSRVDLARFRVTLTHDVFQSLSGQPVPPPTERAWRQVFAKAGCRVIATYEGEASGVQWVCHVVRL